VSQNGSRKKLSHKNHTFRIPFYKLIVPTVDTVRYNYILEKLLLNQCPVMLIGDVGTGKTSLALNLLSSMKGEKYSTFSINMTAQTTAGFIQETLENCTEKRSKNLFVPKNNKQLVCFIDDFNMPAKEEYGAQPPLELLRQWMDYQFWYDLDKLSRKYFKFITLIAGMGPPGGSRETISSRTLSRFNVINFTFPSQDVLFGIFHGMLASHLRSFDGGVQEYAKPITAATLQLYDAIVKKMLPTPSKIHYMFNLRDISKVFQGLLRGHEMFSNSKPQFLRLWVHECFRVLSDRLIDEK
jgi:dynein heavy chain, axonemal